MAKKRYVIQACLSASEFSEFEKAFGASSSTSRGSYIKKLLFGKAIKIYYRDRAFDAFIEAGVQFNKDVKLLLSEGTFNEDRIAGLVELANAIKTLLIKIDDHVRKTRKNRQRPQDD